MKVLEASACGDLYCSTNACGNIQGGNTSQPCWVNSGCSMAYLSSFQVVASMRNLSS